MIEVSVREGMVQCVKGKDLYEEGLKAVFCRALELTRWRVFDPFLLHLQISLDRLLLESLVWEGKAARAEAL